MKRLFSLFMTMIMIICIIPIAGLEQEASATSKTVSEAMSWCESLVGRKVGTGQCVALIKSYYEYLGVSPVSGNACDYATNSLPGGWSRVKGGTPQAGDILVYTGATYGHVAIYAGGTVSYHQNMAGQWVEKKTSWPYNNSWWSSAEGGQKSYWGYIRPNFNQPSGHTRDTNYGTNFTATAKERIDVWNADHSDPGNRYIDPGDVCTIHEVYTDGCCKVTYPTSSGTQTFYAKISSFSWGNNPTGCLDSASGGAGAISISGWAFDADDYSASLSIHVYIGGAAGDSNAVGYGWIVANKERPDVNNVYGCGNYHGFSETISTDKRGNQPVYIYLINVDGGGNQELWHGNLNITEPTYGFDVNMVIDGTAYNSGKSGFTFDLSLNGSLAANDATDYANHLSKGTTFQISDIKCPSDYSFTGGTTSGTVNSSTEIRLTFSKRTYSLDVNLNVDGTQYSSGLTGYTFDMYINGSLVKNDAEDYYVTQTHGDRFEIKDIKCPAGYYLSGGTTTGTVTSATTITLTFSKSAYYLTFDVNHDNIRQNLYKPTKSSKTVNGVDYSYNQSDNTMILNGTLTGDGLIDSFPFTPEVNSVYKVTSTVVSGSISAGFLVVEAVNISGKGLRTRTYLDTRNSNSAIWIFDSALAAESDSIHTWMWYDGTTTVYNDLVVKIKIEKISSSSDAATEFSPCMKGMHVDESYGTLMTPVREGYDFLGWYTEPTDGTKITSDSTYPASNQTLYAHWKSRNINVSFEPNGGRCDTLNKTVTYNSPYGGLPVPTREGYNFDGWYTEEIGGDLVTSDTIVIVAADHTLYAHWVETDYNVTLNADGGTCDIYSKTVKYSCVYGELPIPTRVGYTFAGWFTSADGGERIESTTIVTATADHTLYAHWNPCTYIVSFDANGGTCDTQSIEYIYGAEGFVLPLPIKTGYRFDGWYDESDQYVGTSGETYTVGADTELIAHWTLIDVGDNPAFVVSNETIVKGKNDEVDVKINIENNPGIIATVLSVTYDKNKLELVKVTDGGLIGENTLTAGNDLQAVPYNLIWEDALSSHNYTDDGTLVTLTFRVKDDADLGFIPITVSYDAGSTFDYDMNEVDFYVVDGEITVTELILGDSNTDGSIDLKDVVIINRWLVGGWDVTLDETSADVNKDGTVNLKDAVIIRRYLAGDIDSL